MLRFRWLLAAVFAVFVAAFVACSGSGSTTGIPPITGIVIRAETVTTGRGCGRGENQVFKYAAIVYGYTEGPADVEGSYNTPVTAGIYDCFADGTFVELPAVGGSFTFRLDVFAYTASAYEAARTTIESAGANGDAFRTTNPTWSTVCTATQLRDVQTLAVCDPLISGLQPTSVILPTGAFSRADGRVSVCARTSGDAGSDAGDGGDAGDLLDGGDDAADAGGDGDASTDAGTSTGIAFLTVRAKARANGVEVVPQTDLACPETFVIPNATAGAPYEIDVTLLDGAGASVGSTKCSARPAAGTETAATCAPIQ